MITYTKSLFKCHGKLPFWRKNHIEFEKVAISIEMGLKKLQEKNSFLCSTSICNVKNQNTKFFLNALVVACIFTYLFRYLFTFSQMPLFGCWEWTHQWYHKVKIYPKNAQSHLTWPFFIIVILGLLKSYVTCKRYTENIISTQNWVGKIDDSVCVMSNTMGFSKG